MTAASLTYRAYVPCSGSLGIDREPAFVRTCARLRWRAHESIRPGLNRTFDTTPPVIQSASQPLRAVGKQRTAIERNQPLVALAVRSFISQGTRLITNLAGYLSRWSFLDALLKPAKQTSGVDFILSRPCPFVATAHDEQHATKEHQACSKNQTMRFTA